MFRNEIHSYVFQSTLRVQKASTFWSWKTYIAEDLLCEESSCTKMWIPGFELVFHKDCTCCSNPVLKKVRTRFFTRKKLANFPFCICNVEINILVWLEGIKHKAWLNVFVNINQKIQTSKPFCESDEEDELPLPSSFTNELLALLHALPSSSTADNNVWLFFVFY